ncbi:MAG: DNA gyrase subunit B [Candidatus Tagabacteria bacterium RIFCSPLOWO2_01_FULL_39_11]|uniref:DNA gyrase subunit B n=1 Tax=Candidatus Tagabacteria bacterium RIFCSPLOWO2_01_FULL_39_11 TaxID=1802295 RepID=A0A1G2LRY9_9BACT|nr:MAG: DNA gyrase subunit B [Candidatus Tagabacteria bacterium RIFCSPLOWO2_01_FULL_39_11]
MAVKRKADKNNDYGAKDIYVLEGLEPVRKRPGMYIGSTGVDGLHHLVWEVFDNSLDEAMAGYASNISVTLLPKSRVRVQDDGRGIPVEIHKQTKKSALETVMTTLHAGAKFGGESYKIAGGLHGVGVSVVNALSNWLAVEVCRDGARWSQEYVRGKPKSKVKKIGRCDKSGTTVTFSPDPEIFSFPETKEIMPDFDWTRIIDHLRQQAYLTKGIRIIVKDERSEDVNLHTSYSFYFEGGISSYIRYLNAEFPLKNDKIFYCAKDINGVLVEVALQYIDDLQSREISFANNIYTPEGGMHLTGFRAGLTRILNDYAKKNNLLKQGEDNFTGEDVREGLTAIISVKLREPQFEGQTKAKLGNPEARTAVENAFSELFFNFLEENPQDARQITEKVFLALKARKAAKAAKDTVLRKGALEGLTLPGKLADCQSRDPEDSEIFIVEGDSAGGSSKMARDRRTQAILPLRGKILNVEKVRIDKMMASKEIKSLIIALGAAIADEFNIEKLRYHKVIIATDADVDGAHIRTLLLTFFYRYYKPVIEGGYLYIAQPPLYRMQVGKEIRYVYNDDEKEKTISEFQKIKNQSFGSRAKAGIADKKIKNKEKEILEESAAEEKEEIKGVSIQRYKGLGEMNPDQLWETTMDPEARVLKQVAIEDAIEADKVFDTLMGVEVAPRKNFIQTYAKEVRNLDI